MQPALLIRLRPAGPWRYGPGDGGEDRLDTLYRSDRLFSSVTLAMDQLGALEEWLGVTARASRPAVVFSSLFPYQAETLFAPPPATLWPPPASIVTAPSPVFLSKIRWNASRFVPLALVESILIGQPILADQWIPDAESGCLLRRDRPSASPFRMVLRASAAVDRLAAGAAHVHSSACAEFESSSGLWCCARFADTAAESTWKERLQACLRLLADTGFGGRRSSGWGQAHTPEFQDGIWPGLLFPKLARLHNGRNGEGPPLHWLLSLYSPAEADVIDWTGGDYQLTVRGGRVGSVNGFGTKKRVVRMVAEGSVIAAEDTPIGVAVDVSPAGFAHPVYRSGFAIALELPAAVPADIRPVEMPSDPEALEPRPCPEDETPLETPGPSETSTDEV